MIEELRSAYGKKSIALLGFGREGQSSYKLFRKVFPEKILTIIDNNSEVRYNPIIKGDSNLNFITGHDSMQLIDEFDLAVKSPGIPSNSLPSLLNRVNITSQTDIFLQLFGRQVIGVTGTKGKSTTSSLISHILKNAGFNALFVGNIGIPPFDCFDEITTDSVIVMELSSHQLEYVVHSPHIAILLNLFQEHLDHYNSYEDYQLAKLNIGKYQKEADYFIYNFDNELTSKLALTLANSGHYRLPFSLIANTSAPIFLENQQIFMQTKSELVTLYDSASGQPLMGHHNLYNIMAAASACYLSGVTQDQISSGIRSFNGLEHRIEPVGNYNEILWYNDSIATIPEATIEAVRTLKTVDTLILGGFDRGIDYSVLYDFLPHSGIKNIIFIGEAGRRMNNELEKKGVITLNIYNVKDYNEVVLTAERITERGKICLLSPAAASYDMFKNFEERGNVFKKNVRELSPSHK